jgi:hypothetical protein
MGGACGEHTSIADSRELIADEKLRDCSDKYADDGDRERALERPSTIRLREWLPGLVAGRINRSQGVGPDVVAPTTPTGVTATASAWNNVTVSLR